jgi:hypothetical protein
VVVLKELEEMQYHEIAKVMNLSLGTVMSRLFYGRKKLQSMLRPIYLKELQKSTPVCSSVKSGPIGPKMQVTNGKPISTQS